MPAAGNSDCVLPLALAGLAALAHRGAFGADGASSDGAGVALPLEPRGPRDPRARPDWSASARRRRAFLPRNGPQHVAARPPLVDDALRGGPRRRSVAGASRSIRRAGRRGRAPAGRSPGRHRGPVDAAPAVRSRTPSSSGGSSSPVVGSRRPPGRRARRARRVASVSCRTVVYKGLVAGGRLGALYPDLRAADPRPLRAVPPALRDEHPADLAPRPAVPLDRPQRRDRHRPRQPRAGPRPDRRRSRGGGGRGPRPRRGGTAPPRRGLRLAVARRDDRAAGRDRLGPGLGAAGRDARGVVPPPRAAPARGHAPTGNRRAARPVGRPGRDRLLRRPPGRGDPRPQRAPTGGVRCDVGPARRGRVGGRGDPPPASDTVRRGRLGPGEMLLVDPRRGAILEDADAKARLLRRLPIHDAPRPAHVDRRGTRWPQRRGPTPSSLRYLAGLDAEKARLDIKTMASRPTSRSGRWATTRRPRPSAASTARSPTTSASRSPRSRTRRSTRNASGPSWTCGSTSAGGRRCSVARHASSRTLRLDRPVLADRDALLEAFPGRSAGWKRPGRPAKEQTGSRRPSIDSRRGGHRRPAGRERRRPVGPLLLPLAAADPVDPRRRRCQHRAHRRRPPWPDGHPRRRGRRPRRPLPRDDARRRRHGGRAVARGRARDRDGRLPRRGGPDADAAVDNLLTAFEAGLRKTLARMGISTIASYIGGLLFESIELDDDVRGRCFPARRRGRDDRARRHRRAPAPRRAAPRAIAADTPSNRLPDPGFARFRADGEAHLFSPRNAARSALARPGRGDGRSRARALSVGPGRPRGRPRRPARPAAPPSAAVALADVEPAATSSGGSSCRRCRSGRSRRRPTRR